jgi:hypothetical protein
MLQISELEPNQWTFLVEDFSPLNKPLADRGKGEKMKTKSIKKAPLS